MGGPGVYRFEPLERRGLLLGLGAGQVALLAGAVVASVLAIATWPGLAGAAMATALLAGAGALCRPWAGRPALQWAAIVAGFVSRSRGQASLPPGHRRGATAAALPPDFVPGLRVCELPATADDAGLGAVWDRRSGTLSGLLRSRGGAFCLADEQEKAALLAGWAGVLEALAARQGSLATVQWCQRALPADGEALLAHLRKEGSRAAPGFGGQLDLVAAAGARSWRHETLLVLTVRAHQGRASAPAPEDVAVLRDELRSLRSHMRAIGLVCEGALGPRAAARALGDQLVPGLGQRQPGPYPWPLAWEEHWDAVRVDGLWHRTYWVAEWPRSGVGPDFLSPLLMGQGRRAFCVTMAPISPERAARDAESARTAQLADARLRAQGGFLETAKQRRQAEAVQGREAELADGRGVFELSGYVSVAASGRAELQAAGAELERSAASAQLRLRPLYGQQREALYRALPLGRGL